MQITTHRLILRPWREADAESLFEYARDPRVGPSAAWPAHSDVEYSRYAIREFLSGDNIFAITLKDSDDAIGSVGILLGEKSNFALPADEGEIGYWIGVPFWGRGLIPEAVCAIMRLGFENLGLTKLWAGYFDGNEQSRRVQEKCGFRYHHTDTNKSVPLLGEVRTEHITCLTKEQWMKKTYNDD